METIVERKQTSFRLRTDLLKRMEKEASKENRSLNDFVESILMDNMYFQPNETTLAAMREAESGVELEELDVDNFIEYVKSL
ncbi:toxin-antitoxin system protein [Tannerella sp. oral taxon BU063 isolate Cell 1/3]|jgi:toxin-antitoxin system protein|uniref:Toxin-antitoxin system protein n=2 Tax=Tannerella serpentiformis TaxID=712710 RepID=W2CFQ5_9BACT|nr:toxin-antitoxin system protein [Tannerella sp. oral taxon BU063 isolate Cell 1/3]ETK12479.1 toxin-antitoxin system protein [Tannerella sp. oral taxon BU063 isolate Cell 8/11]